MTRLHKPRWRSPYDMHNSKRKHFPPRTRFTLTPTNKRPKLAPDDAYLSYHDVRLTYEDVQTIKNDWLTEIGRAHV